MPGRTALRRCGALAQRVVLCAAWWLNAASPWLFVAGMWALLLVPQQVERLLPHATLFLRAPPAARQALLLLPQTKHEAWRLGSISAQLNAGTLSDAVAWQQAAEVLPGVSALEGSAAEVMASMEALLEQQSQPSSRVAAFFSMLSLARLLWLASILGLCITVGPAAYWLLRPLLRHAQAAWIRLVRVLAPLLRFLWALSRVLLRPLCLYTCLAAAAAAGRPSVSAAAAPYLTLTALGLAFTVYFWSLTGEMGAHGDPLLRLAERWLDSCRQSRYHASDGQAIGLLAPPFAALAAAPAAVRLGSQLLGFSAVLAVCTSVYIVSTILESEWRLFGWHPSGADLRPFEGRFSPEEEVEREDNMVRQHLVDGGDPTGDPSAERPITWREEESAELWCYGVSAAVCLAFWATATQLLGPDAPALHPFRFGAALLGRGGLLTVGLLRCWEGTHWLEVNAAYLASLLGSMAVGAATGRPGVHRSALLFLVLWAATKLGELSDRVNQGARWVLWFGFFLAIWRASLALTSNPAWVASAFGL